MDSTNLVWQDFETQRHNIKHNTVDRLKQILNGLNEECSTCFFKSGKKQEIIDRIVNQLDNWRLSNNEEKWVKAKAVLSQVRNSGVYTPARFSTNASVPAVGASPYTSSSVNGYHNAPAGPSSVGRYDPYAPPRKPSGSTTTPSTSSNKPGIRFKPSPFFHIDQAVSTIMECPESTSATDRRQQTVTFLLNHDQIAKLKQPGSKYQLRLFCTSSLFYSPGPMAFRSGGPCPIEFPPTCEVRVNNVQLSANLKGLKKKPGTAPPADLGKAVRISNLQNRVEMVYVNSQQPVLPKKFYLVVMLVEITTVDELVERLKKGKYRSTSEVRKTMTESMSADEDIIAGSQKMSLKCPLSFVRIRTPCRSAQCVHPQCFDATSWFSVMEQTTTWLCPVCEKYLNYEDLLIDGYFDEILRECSESVDDVIVEADGEWHTTDNKYASKAWKSLHPPAGLVKPATPRKPSSLKSSSQTPSKPTLAPADGKGKERSKDVEIVVLDSDDEDEGRVKRELSPSFASGSSISANNSFEGSIPQSQSQIDDVIDLTVDSEDDIPTTVRAEKRKVPEESRSPTEQIWKKGRLENEPSSSNTHVINGQVNDARASSTPFHSPSQPGSITLPPIQYPPAYSVAGASASYPRIPPTASRDRYGPQMPVASNHYMPRPNTSNWS